MSLLQTVENELEKVYHSIVGESTPAPIDSTTPTQPEVPPVTTTFREVLQLKIAAIEKDLAPVKDVYEAAVAKLESAKAELTSLEADFTAVLDKDVLEVKSFFEKISVHFQGPIVPVVVVAPVSGAAAPVVVVTPAPAVEAPVSPVVEVPVEAPVVPVADAPAA